MRFPKVIAVLASVGLMIGLVGTAGALESSRSIDVLFRGISIWVNGKNVPTEQEPFVFEGRTYVPLRAVAEALGLDVSFDEATSQVRINGRAAVRDASGQVVKAAYVQGSYLAQVNGIITNTADRPVASVAIKCTLTDSSGAHRVVYDTLGGSVPPAGMTTFQVLSSFFDEAVEAQAQVPTVCELLEVVYGQE